MTAVSFDDFYRAVHGPDREPFPWQRRLAMTVLEAGWPEEIGIPTGLGKTSCLDVAVWTMATERDVPPSERRMPTRIWYVVNRRLLVDAAWEHGKRLERLLANPADVADLDDRARAVLASAGEALAIRGGAGIAPLHVSRLRGSAELGARPPDPAQPAIIFATVPMYASRWLFRGYGTSHTMRSVDAALAGTDSLVLLDEAHLSRPLMELAEPLAQCDVGDPCAVLPRHRARPTIVSLTATGGAAHPFTLDTEDYEHPIVKRRLQAKKPVRLVTSSKAQLVQRIAAEAMSSLEGASVKAAVVFANSPGAARSIYDELLRRSARRGTGAGCDVLLLTGRIRDREAKAVRSRLMDPVIGVACGRDKTRPRERHLIVVATQTLEVGADLDFDVLVTETCGARALVQRLGRLNRLGDIDDAAGVVVHAEDEQTFGVYGDEPLQIWDRLRAAALDGTVDLGPERAGDVLGAPADPAPRHGELLPAHLWEWAKTTVAPPGEAPLEPFYEGIGNPDVTVSVIWRVVVPEEDGAELHPTVSEAESIEVPVWEVRDVLQARGVQKVVRLQPDRVTVERIPTERIRPGDVVVLPADAGLYDEFGWAPDAKQTVFDLSLLRPPGIPLVPAVVDQLVAEGGHRDAAHALVKQLADSPGLDEDVDTDVLAQELLDELQAAGPGPLVAADEWSALMKALQPEVISRVDEPVGRLVVVPSSGGGVQVELRSDAFDELSFPATSTDLAQHLGSVGEVASRIARQLGLPEPLVRAVGAAGRFHDIGKADVRFQRWLDPLGEAQAPLAKSSGRSRDWERDRVAAGWPRGGRHEELSRRLVAAYLQSHEPDWDAELVLHLVVAHHGYGRPLVTGVQDNGAIAVHARLEGTDIVASGDLQEIDWEQPARFRRCCERYGYWGVALLEAIVRQADHEVSRVAVA
jgi:CRISPR-associated endonuclease/helicase Cas3